VKEGLIVSNVVLQQDTGHSMFCLPPKLAVTLEQAENILIRAAKRIPDPGSMPISILLLAGFKDTFPCDK
jgi:hypothetical protein